MSDFVMLDLAPPSHVPMPGALTVRDAGRIHARLLQAVREQQKVVVDCSDATEIDLAFVQLVFAARKSATSAGRELSVIPPAGGLLADVLRRAGLLGGADTPLSADHDFWFNKEATGGEDRSHSR
jgi:hypothetical protein